MHKYVQKASKCSKIRLYVIVVNKPFVKMLVRLKGPQSIG